MAQTEDQIKTKYQPVLNTIQQVNGSLKNVNMEGDKLFIRAEVGNDQLKNQVWNTIKQTDASYSDLHADIIINPALAPAERTYKVQSGDSLSKIAQQFYGKASEYQKIFDANKGQLKDPDHVPAGIDLVIPA